MRRRAACFADGAQQRQPDRVLGAARRDGDQRSLSPRALVVVERSRAHLSHRTARSRRLRALRRADPRLPGAHRRVSGARRRTRRPRHHQRAAHHGAAALLARRRRRGGLRSARDPHLPQSRGRRAIARSAGRHGVRPRLRALAEIQPARRARRARGPARVRIVRSADRRLGRHDRAVRSGDRRRRRSGCADAARRRHVPLAAAPAPPVRRERAATAGADAAQGRASRLRSAAARRGGVVDEGAFDSLLLEYSARWAGGIDRHERDVRLNAPAHRSPRSYGAGRATPLERSIASRHAARDCSSRHAVASAAAARMCEPSSPAHRTIASATASGPSPS